MRLQPVSPLAWVTGKWLVVVLFAWTGAVVTTLVSVFALQRFAPSIASSLALSPTHVALLCLTALPVALVASAVCFGLALQARSTMEAQTRLTLVTLLPVGLGLMIATSCAIPSGWTVPTLHELTALPEWIAGAPFPTQESLTTTLFAVVAVTSRKTM